MNRFAKIIHNKELNNALWIIGGKVVQMTLSFVVSVLSARYLGPSNLGIIDYVSSYIAFFSAFCTLGINGLIINDFVEHPDEEGTTIGTTILMRAVSSLLSGIMIVAIVSILDRDEPITIIVSVLCSFSLIFRIFCIRYLNLAMHAPPLSARRDPVPRKNLTQKFSQEDRPLPQNQTVHLSVAAKKY